MECEESILLVLCKHISGGFVTGLACDSIEDPVIACWLVEPEVQPSSFRHMCQTAHIQYDAVSYIKVGEGCNVFGRMILFGMLLHSKKEKCPYILSQFKGKTSKWV